MDPDVNQPGDLRHAIESYERVVRRRREPVERKAAPPPTRPLRQPRWQRVARLAVVAGLVPVAAILFVETRERNEPVAAQVVESAGTKPVQIAGRREHVALGAGRQLTDQDGDSSRGGQSDPAVTRIVLDPGHGGYDPGARAHELSEAALVLDVARRLETRLEAETGIEVILTRRDDVYMPLRARTELANRVGADLFLSIHANAAQNDRAGGIATYHLDFATDPTAQAAAARENATSQEGMHDLPHLVRLMAMDNTRDESRDLAELVQRNLIRGIRELHPQAQALGVKQAPFVVLIGANMPSVLTEISFLSNQEEAAFLASDAYLDRISDALLQSILEYQQTLTRSPSFTAENND